MKSQKKSLMLYAVVHTESFFNRRKIFTGWKDSKLTPLGHRNAEMMARKLKVKDIGIAFISPLTRTRQTARHILAYHKGIPIVVDKRLRERSYGKLAGKSKEKFARENPKLWPVYHRSYDVPPPGGESLKQVEKRVLAFLKEAIAKMKKEQLNGLVVLHGNSMRPLRRYFEKLTPAEMMQLEGQYNKIYEYKIPLA